MAVGGNRTGKGTGNKPKSGSVVLSTGGHG